MTILLAEDDTNIANLVRYKLERGGYTVEWHWDGAQAGRRLGEHCPDLAILDINLPGVSGVELLRRLKGDLRTSHVPVLMLTANSEKSVVTGCLELGADDYLVKPFKPALLVERVNRLLRAHENSSASH